MEHLKTVIGTDVAGKVKGTNTLVTCCDFPLWRVLKENTSTGCPDLQKWYESEQMV